jgi:hypothetical protein
MNILEQLSIAKKRNTLKVTTLRELRIGETFEFAADDPLRVGEMVYVCIPRDYAYGRAVITNNPRKSAFVARRTS